MDSQVASKAISKPSLCQILTIKDLQEVGSQRLAKEYRGTLSITLLQKADEGLIRPLFTDYLNEGADDMVTLRENVQAYNKYKIRPRVLINVSQLDTSTSLFGQKVRNSQCSQQLTFPSHDLQIPLPFGFSPAAVHKLAHPEGEVATSRAAAKHGVPMGLSFYASSSIEDVTAEGLGNPYAMHIPIMKDKRLTIEILRRIEKAGVKAVFVTVDTPVLGQRLNEQRNHLRFPANITFPNMVFKDNKPAPKKTGASLGFKTIVGDELQMTQTWDSLIPWLKSNTRLQIWLKGIYHPDDVKKAIEYGCDGVIISNHGGRQLDSVPATIDVLAACAKATFATSIDGSPGKRLIQIAVDGGIRRGSDIFKAIALGAQMCFLGRVPIWGLAVSKITNSSRMEETANDHLVWRGRRSFKSN
jgi:(S)-2-hydroxy-acid oxidase